MNGLEFIASVVASLAWPATVVAAFFELRSHLPGLFPFVERPKYKDFEVEFRRSVQELGRVRQVVEKLSRVSIRRDDVTTLPLSPPSDLDSHQAPAV